MNDPGSIAFIEFLLEHYPQAAKVPAEEFYYPLHMVCNQQYYSETQGNVILQLLKVYPEAAKDTDRLGRMPLHLYLEHDQNNASTNQPTSGIAQAICQAYPDALQQGDCQERFNELKDKIEG